MIKKILKTSACFLLLGLSYLTPRNKSIWLFGSSRNCFNDNSKYLYIYILEKHPNIRAVWISHNKKHAKYLKNSFNIYAYYKWSIKGIYYSLTGKYYFYNYYISDINTWTYGRATKINLWHGIPIKKIEFDINKGPLSHIFNNSLKSKISYFNHYVKPNFILSTSKLISSLFASAFRVEQKKCLEYGYPRNDILTVPDQVVFNHIMKYEPKTTLLLINSMKKFDKTFVYMPTWRDNDIDFIEAANIDFISLNALLSSKNYLLILKLHSNTNLPIDLAKYPNIVLFNSKADIYPVLPYTDALITDYSSICFDYKLMNKPVVFYCFDKDDYTKNRELYFVYDEVIKDELVATDFNSLLNILRNDKSLIYRDSKFFKSKINKYNSKSSEALVNHFNSLN